MDARLVCTTKSAVPAGEVDHLARAAGRCGLAQALNAGSSRTRQMLLTGPKLPDLRVVGRTPQRSRPWAAWSSKRGGPSGCPVTIPVSAAWCADRRANCQLARRMAHRPRRPAFRPACSGGFPRSSGGHRDQSRDGGIITVHLADGSRCSSLPRENGCCLCRNERSVRLLQGAL